MLKDYPYTAIKYQFFSDLPLITLVGIGLQDITDHAYSWHNLHRRDKHCLLQYCISGQGALTVNNSTYTVSKGKAFLINIPGNSHYYLPQNSSRWKFIYLEFSAETLPLLCKIHNRLGPVIYLEKETELIQQISSFYEHALNNTLNSLFLNTKLAYNFWMDLLNYSLAYSAENSAKIDIAKQYIEHNYRKSTLNIDMLADETGYSKYHLCKKFHKQFGISPMKYLQQMLGDGRKEGLDFWVCSAYRTIEKQTELYEDKVRRLEAEGMSRQEALSGAAAVVAYPGTSEHNLGLAVDIVARDYQLLDERQEETAEQQWLMKNCWRYGFILRYPTDKTEETGIIYEPWHYRYVGREAAEEITRQEICLEEYLGYESSQLPEGTGQGDTEAYRRRPDAASSAA